MSSFVTITIRAQSNLCLFEVTACDSPSVDAQLCAAAPQTVSLTVGDVNNFPPVCTLPTFHFTQDDQYAADTTIGTLSGNYLVRQGFRTGGGGVLVRSASSHQKFWLND